MYTKCGIIYSNYLPVMCVQGRLALDSFPNDQTWCPCSLHLHFSVSGFHTSCGFGISVNSISCYCSYYLSRFLHNQLIFPGVTPGSQKLNYFPAGLGLHMTGRLSHWPANSIEAHITH